MLPGLLLLSGCQNCLSSWCMGEETYQEIYHPIPYIKRWEKTSMTPEDRLQDSADCGGGASDYSPTLNHRIEREKLPGETPSEAYNRLHKEWQRCMLKKGYIYKGKCYDNEVSRASPACGAP